MCKKKKIQKAGNLDHIFDSKESTACLPDFELSLFLGKTSVSFFFPFFYVIVTKNSVVQRWIYLLWARVFRGA